MSKRRWNWVLVVAALVPALVIGNYLAFAAASGEETRIARALVACVVVILLCLAGTAFGAWRVYQEYSSNKRLW